MTDIKETIETVDGYSPDFKSELAKKINELVPETVADGKIDLETLKQLLGDDAHEEKERYGLFWPGKIQAQKLAQKTTSATLKPDKSSSKDWDTTNNVYIEGDNLEVLKVLQNQYHNKIKMIYIDPPYNTGHDFVYKDNFKDSLKEYLEYSHQTDECGGKLNTNKESEGRFHSKWLTMMYPRLKLAKNLLTDDGAIFISIDDNEQANCKKICDEIFGEENCKGLFVWRKTHTQTNIGDFARVKEYILCYSKNINDCVFNRIPLTNLEEYRYSDENGDKFRRINLIDSTRGRYEYEIMNSKGCIIGGKWMKPKEEIEQMIKNGEVYWAGNTPYGKNYLYKMEKKGQIANDFLGIEYGTNQRSTMHLDKMMDNHRVFDFSKPVELIKHFVRLESDRQSVVFDFFSGSATTAHAVVQLNAEDGGNRKFIMVQLPEPTGKGTEACEAGYNTICELGEERIRRAGEKIKTEMADKLKNREQPLDVGFRVYKLSRSNFKKWSGDKAKSVEALQMSLLASEKEVVSQQTPEDILTELLLKDGYQLDTKVQQVDIDGLRAWTTSDKTLLAILGAQKPTLAQLRKITDQESLTTLIVLDDVFDGDDELKTNLAEICKTKDIHLKVA